jgi:hypothetical protein
MMGNYFEIEDAQEWQCYIYEITEDASVLLSVARPAITRKRKRITFQNVVYICCPTVWASANFELGSAIELKKVLESLTPSANSADHYQLFIVRAIENAEVIVQIVATSASIRQ